MRLSQTGNYADRQLPVVLRMHELPLPAVPEAGGLLHFLLLRHGEMPVDADEHLLPPTVTPLSRRV
jgi:hypothetical protein